MSMHKLYFLTRYYNYLYLTFFGTKCVYFVDQNAQWLNESNLPCVFGLTLN
ncbi:hypothetical protein JHK86_011318 [Glycine max]|nr:hypothetical protein JHK86_011318 [Glycine max]